MHFVSGVDTRTWFRPASKRFCRPLEHVWTIASLDQVTRAVLRTQFSPLDCRESRGHSASRICRLLRHRQRCRRYSFIHEGYRAADALQCFQFFERVLDKCPALQALQRDPYHPKCNRRVPLNPRTRLHSSPSWCHGRKCLRRNPDAVGRSPRMARRVNRRDEPMELQIRRPTSSMKATAS